MSTKEEVPCKARRSLRCLLGHALPYSRCAHGLAWKTCFSDGVFQVIRGVRNTSVRGSKSYPPGKCRTIYLVGPVLL
eukprot:6196659-Amphidinium_carterae.1